MKPRVLVFCSVVILIVVIATILYILSTPDQPRTANTSELHPSGSDIEKALVTKLPAFTRVSNHSVVSSHSVEAENNIGANVVWQARIRATITVTTDTFALENEDSNENSEITFVQPVKRSGESIEVLGKTVSELDAGAWQTTVELEGQPIETLGQPLTAFGPKKVIARGSEDEKQYLADKQKAEIKNAKIKILEGTISSFECGHACYLTITDKKGKELTEYCDAALCGAWWTRPGGFMPARYKGKRVRITVVKKLISYDVEGVEPSVMDVFNKIQFLTAR